MWSTFNNTPEYISEAVMTDKINLAVEKFPEISMQMLPRSNREWPLEIF